jgi:hypothetical protein
VAEFSGEGVGEEAPGQGLAEAEEGVTMPDDPDEKAEKAIEERIYLIGGAVVLLLVFILWSILSTFL